MIPVVAGREGKEEGKSRGEGILLGKFFFKSVWREKREINGGGEEGDDGNFR